MSETIERPRLNVLQYVNPAAFAPRHAVLLTRLCEDAWDGTTPVDLAKRIAVADLWLFEAREPDAIVLLSTSWYKDSEVGQFNVEGLAGDGVLARADDFRTDILNIAKYYGGKRVAAVTALNGIPLDKVGFAPVATVWHMEMTDGRIAEEHDDNSEG